MRAVSCLAPGIPERLFETLARAVGADVWFQRHASGPEPGDDPFADGRADLGWICSTSYADQSWAAGPGVQLLGIGWVPDDPGPWPVQPLVVRADLPEEVVSGLRTTLLDARLDPPVQAALADAALVDLVPVDASAYEAVRRRLSAV